MMIFLLRSSFRNASANCWRRIKFLTEFAVRLIDFTLLNLILRSRLMILCTSRFLPSSWCSSWSFYLTAETESRNVSAVTRLRIEL